MFLDYRKGKWSDHWETRTKYLTLKVLLLLILSTARKEAIRYGEARSRFLPRCCYNMYIKNPTNNKGGTGKKVNFLKEYIYW